MAQAPHPRMHGLTHLPGGSDPIPPAGDGCVPFPDRVASIADTHAPDSLLGYWRLGEGSSPYADTSGHSYGPADASIAGTGTAMTASITGALPPDDDDGAVQFNNTSGGAAEYLDAGDPGAHRFDLVGGSSTVAAWVKPAASAGSFVGNVVGVWVSTGGWRLAVEWPGRKPYIIRQDVGGAPVYATTAAALPADEWSFLVGTFSSSSGHNLYVDGALVASDPGVAVALPASHFGPSFGHGDTGTLADSFYGGIDEVSIWNVALTPAEVADLYTSGLPCVPGSGIDAAAATEWWFPLVDSDGSNVLDSNGALIPTLIPL